MRVMRPLESGPQLSGESTGAAGVSEGWIVLGMSRAECLEVGKSDLRDIIARSDVVSSWSELTRPGIDAVAVLSQEVAELFSRSADNIFCDIPWFDLWVTILLPWREPPTRSVRADGRADAFCCSAEVFSDLLEIERAESCAALCFKLLNAVMNGRIAVQRLQVRQLPLSDSASSLAASSESAALIMAHRGPKHFLVSALRFATALASHSEIKIRVGLDMEDIREYRSVAEAFQNVEFFSVKGSPVGPYVIRQALIEGSNERLIVFHDSDDISCHDRVVRQAAEILGRGVDVVGSHELRVNEPEGTVEVYRFPLDVSAALGLPGATEQNDRANEPLLHPTVTMVRRGFVEAGGFSTNRKIANDTQFMLRAYFSLRMRNVDDFLYIRRRHAHALTVERRTALGTPLRHFLGSTWGADFDAVKSGKARLEETSLRARLDPLNHQLARLWKT